MPSHNNIFVDCVALAAVVLRAIWGCLVLRLESNPGRRGVRAISGITGEVVSSIPAWGTIALKRGGQGTRDRLSERRRSCLSKLMVFLQVKTIYWHRDPMCTWLNNSNHRIIDSGVPCSVPKTAKRVRAALGWRADWTRTGRGSRLRLRCA